ncbi:5'-nucleotidase C-terminal domain-containing protein [Paenibacillus sp. sptzw28]|uniref:5'-nucleotidase C-terminal domain-containing protein n=1 Tax=Paenibacillus sp. sptzw28 TaxID=715179 RepID=UPI001C6F09CB|nr:5'-nucleotidase C-terminal domain-containing protein [Paenibacillus sp. sptzw28]QYR22682.1 5'-nucleotidase C-terminal domain-containing protein [Paenibacillus sp. sptzw28]
MKSRFAKVGLAFLAYALLFTTVFGSLLTPVYAEDGRITVGAAIANNSGTATVEGYVVAHTTGTNAYDFEAPFGNDYNLALADAPGERDTAHMLPVQIPASFRAEYGLQTNPQLIGSKIRVTGTLSAYYTVPGIKSPTAFETAAPSDPNPNEPELLTIAEAKARIGQTVIVEGVVTADNAAIGGGKLSTYIQDATGGINVFQVDPFDLHEGDLVRLTGKIAEYKGLTEIMPAAVSGIEVLESGKPLPAPEAASIGTLSEALEGRLVKLKGFIQQVPGSPAGGGYNISLIDSDFKGTTLRVMEGSIPVSDIQPGKWYEITAIVSQYDSYQLIPRKASDLVMLDPQPPAPSAAGEYDSVVESVVDGDTIHLQTPVLGVTKVRFLNVDTPETYHTVHNELDQNQLDHGNAAKAHLNTLLRPGDQVTLKVGQEATDDYGRLLAQVIRKSDGMNVNLQMVRDGFAVTYFIWPISDDFELFSQAVKEAKSAGLGIWSASNPLLELPFVFRAREQGKGLLRYVGNYATKRYVAPEDWGKVPVESRIFFASEQEAQANGYAPEQPGSKEPIHVQLLGVNDFHGKIDVTGTVSGKPGVNYGRADYLAAYLRQREAGNPNTLIIHAGDMVGASSPVSALLQDEPTVDIMESIGFDVGVPGNHEFDEGTAEMLRLVHGGQHPNGTPGYDGMNFPVVLANVEFKSNGQLVLPPYALKEVGGVKIGFIGVVTTETPSIVMPEGIADIRFTDEAEAVNKYVPELQAQGVEAIVVLAHVPGEQDGISAKGDIADLAMKVSDAVDVIYAGHNHVKVNAVVDNKLIVQSWEYGKAFSDVDLDIDPVTRDIIGKSAEIVDVIQSEITPDPAVAAIIQHYKDVVAPKVNEVIGTNDLALSNSYPTKDIFGDNGLGNLIADGMRAGMNSDFALMNGGGVRDDLDVGPITWGEMFNIQPFGNTLVRIEVTGAQFVDILNAMISPQYGPDSFIAGARYTWNTSTNKVERLTLDNGEPINPAAVYTLTVNNFMYSQTTSKYKLLGQYGRNVTQGPEDITASVDYIKSLTSPVHYAAAEGRISSDVAAPVINAPEEWSIYTYDKLQLNIEAADAGSGLGQLTVMLDGKPVNPATEIAPLTLEPGDYTVEVKAFDKVGNEATKSIPLHVIMDLHHLDELVLAGINAGKISHAGTINVLMNQARIAQKIALHNAKVIQMQLMQNFVKAQSGKKIEAAFAELLIRNISYAITQMK